MPAASKILRVLPDADRVDEAMSWEAIEGRGFVDGSAWASFGQLLERLEGAQQLQRRPCTALTSRIVLWSAASALPEGPFGSYVQEPAFARSALELFFEVKGGDLRPDGFAAAVETLPEGRRERARFLARLYAAYEAKLGALGLADREDVVRGACERLETLGFPPSFAGLAQLDLSGLYDFPALRQRLVLALAQACEKARVELAVEIPAAGAPAVDALVDGFFAAAEKHAQGLTRFTLTKATPVGGAAGLAPRLFVEAQASMAAVPQEKKRSRAHPGQLDLFGGAAAKSASPAPALGKVALCALATPRHEARFLARQARHHLEEGHAPEEVVIAFRELGEEAEWTAEALRELGVPVRLRRGVPLGSTGVGATALELCAWVEEHFPADQTARLIGSRYLRKVARGAPDAPGTLLAQAAVRDDRVGAEGGKGAYQVRLGGLAERLERREHGGRDARKLLEVCEQVMALLRRIPAEARAHELHAAWWDCVRELGVLDSARELDARDGSENSLLQQAVLRALAQDQAAVEALGELAAELAAALQMSGAGQQRMRRRTFSRWLQDAAADVNLSPRGPRGGAVRILDVRELWGRRVECLLVGGMTDGRFPGRDLPRPLLSEDDCAAINSHHERSVFRLYVGDRGSRVPFRLANDRLLFFLALHCARQSTVFTFARETSPGREQLASPFLDELQRLTGLLRQDFSSELLPDLAKVRGEQALRERVALELHAPPGLRASRPDPRRAALRQVLQAEPWVAEAKALSEVERERLVFFSNEKAIPGPFSGAILDPDLLPALDAIFEFGSENPLSASTLGKLGNCAFQGFLTHALRLREPDEVGEDLDSRGRGSFWHAVVERAFPKLRDAGLLGKDVAQIPDALLDGCVEEAATEYAAEGHVGHPALWRLGQERARGMVRALLGSKDRGLPFPELVPRGTEVVFGPEASDPAWRRVILPAVLPGEREVHFKGSIDRIDTLGERAAVIDYKTSLRKDYGESLLVSEFQLPLYLLAARASGHVGAVDAGLLVLGTGHFEPLNKLLKKQVVGQLLGTEEKERGMAAEAKHLNLANRVHGLLGELRQGNFGARPHDCEYCAFASVCRKSDRILPEDAEE